MSKSDDEFMARIDFMGLAKNIEGMVQELALRSQINETKAKMAEHAVKLVSNMRKWCVKLDNGKYVGHIMASDDYAEFCDLEIKLKKLEKARKK